MKFCCDLQFTCLNYCVLLYCVNVLSIDISSYSNKPIFNRPKTHHPHEISPWPTLLGIKAYKPKSIALSPLKFGFTKIYRNGNVKEDLAYLNGPESGIGPSNIRSDLGLGELTLPIKGMNASNKYVYPNQNLSKQTSNIYDHEAINRNNFKPIVALNYAQRNTKPKYEEKIISLDNSSKEAFMDYPMNNTTFLILQIPTQGKMKIVITSIDRDYTDFLVVQVHSQSYKVILSFKRSLDEGYANDTNPGVVLFMPSSRNESSSPEVYVHNHHSHPLSVLLLVRNYTNEEPIPGGLFNPNSTHSFPHPYLFINQNLLTTWISFPLASLSNITYRQPVSTIPTTTLSAVDNGPMPLTPAVPIKYDMYLTYMYEGDLYEDHYWQSVVKTSTVEGLKLNAKKVVEIFPWQSTDWIQTLFVSYSGVGAVVGVVASFNGSKGVLYSSSVFYGCDFIADEKYNCTKLVSTFAKIFCASLPFVGFVLLFLGHRWLNFTMFIAGFLWAWFLLFVIFVHVPNCNIDVLGLCTFVGAWVGGIGWLVAWHKFHRPFYSGILIILLSSLFTAMISTHFLKYALVPTRHNMAAFVLFPVFFSVAVVAYSIFDIKRIHIFSCCLLGSYACVVPFAFYYGSSLTYIVINIVSTMTIPKFSSALGYPPFQSSDIVLLCVWILLFAAGIIYQTYRERSAPPFYPPNLSHLSTVLNALALLKDRVRQCVCGHSSSDDDSLFEDRPSLLARLGALCSCRGSQGPERLSAYESFPRIGSEDEAISLKETLIRPFRSTFAFLRQSVMRFGRRGESEILRDETRTPVGGDAEPLGDQERDQGVNRETEFENDHVRSPLRNGQV